MPRKGYTKTAVYKANARQYNKKRKQQRLELLAQLKNVPCADCGLRYPACCMDFDHRPGTTKINDLTKMVSYAIEKILEEVAKCDVVCANCHRIRTALRMNWHTRPNA